MADPDYRSCARAGIGALQRWYDPSSGLWRGTGWWNCANALTAVIRYTKVTGDGRAAGVISTTFTQARRLHADPARPHCPPAPTPSHPRPGAGVSQVLMIPAAA